jgi:hypothetical protein
MPDQAGKSIDGQFAFDPILESMPVRSDHHNLAECPAQGAAMTVARSAMIAFY